MRDDPKINSSLISTNNLEHNSRLKTTASSCPPSSDPVPNPQAPAVTHPQHGSQKAPRFAEMPVSTPIIMINKIDIPRPLGVMPHELLVPFRPLVLRVPRQHALDTHAHALHILHRAPAGGAEEVEADDAVGVDVWVDRDGAVWWGGGV